VTDVALKHNKLEHVKYTCSLPEIPIFGFRAWRLVLALSINNLDADLSRKLSNRHAVAAKCV